MVHEIGLHAVAHQGAEVKVVLAARVVSDAAEAVIHRGLGVVEAHAALGQGVILATQLTKKRWLTAGEDFQVDLQPANALLVSQEPHQGYFVDMRWLQLVLRKPCAVRRVV